MEKNKTILIVDDEEVITSCIQEFLSVFEYEFIVANTGQQALDVLSSQSVDLVLLDIMMPELDGFEVCKSIKGNPETKNIPVLMITALKEVKDRIMSMKAGADDFLPKPFDMTELQIRVKSLLRIKSYHDEVTRSRDVLQEKNAELEQLEEFKKDLLNMIVHDLKGPLTPIVFSLELLRRERHEFSSENQKHLDVAFKHCRDLQDMVDEILMIARMEEDKMTLNLAHGHLQTLTHDVMGAFSKEIQAKKITSTIEVDPEVPEVIFDHSIIRRVIFNLADNAYRHTPVDGKINVTIGLSDDRRKIIWSIWNSGIGIPPAMHEEIFQKFAQASGKKAGLLRGKSGLGLPFCNMAITAHGGNIWLESNGDSQGARFTFSLPVEV